MRKSERGALWPRGSLASLGIIGQYGARKVTLQLGQCVDLRKGWVAHVCSCHSVPYGLELSVVSQEVTGRQHLPDRYKVCLGSVLETIEGRLVGSTLRHLTLRQCDRFEDTDKKTTQAP